MYCDAYENITDVIQEDDRTFVITILQICSKVGIVIAILSLFIPLDILLVIAIWTILFSTSGPGKRLGKSIWPMVIHYNRLTDKFIKKVSKSSVVGKVMVSKINSSQIIKQFYIYEHQRWWVTVNWTSEYYSD